MFISISTLFSFKLYIKKYVNAIQKNQKKFIKQNYLKNFVINFDSKMMYKKL